MAFHSVRTLSSRPGWTRVARASKSRRRASSTSGGRARGAPSGRRRMLRPSKFPRVGDPVPFGGHGSQPRAHRGGHLGRGPHVEATLLALGVGVLGGAQPAPRGAELGEHVADGLLDDLEPARLTGHLPGVQVGAHQPGLVVEHLLEVRHGPRVVGGVTGEPTSDVVVDPARGHGPEGGARHGERRLLSRWRDGGAGTAPPTGPGGTWARARIRPRRSRSARRARRRRTPPAPVPAPRGRGSRPGTDGEVVGQAGATVDGVGQGVGLSVDLVAAVVPDVVHGVEHPAEARHAVEVARGEVGPAEEGTAVGREEHRHRPPTATGHGLDRLHVDGVDVGTLLTVHLDRDEAGVELVGGGSRPRRTRAP